jgi:hypothetical protein
MSEEMKENPEINGENGLIAHEIYILLKEHGYKEFVKKYDVFVCLQIDYAAINRHTSSCTYNTALWGAASLEDGGIPIPIPTGAPGVLGLSELEKGFIEKSHYCGVCCGKHFFDETRDWKELVTKEDFMLFKTDVLARFVLFHDTFPFKLYFKRREKKNE